ncbi:hypothetical protein EYF80_048351 [Liparis tanakae]|uniref:Uncharacterized protein n=1 Tax=Liparis tanakae TaxID=230148 RepID=A0A4Z2FL64_9TELE|nr:hypothetical protein EYF80_048351 [Liparis tanakae]
MRWMAPISRAMRRSSTPSSVVSGVLLNSARSTWNGSVGNTLAEGDCRMRRNRPKAASEWAGMGDMVCTEDAAAEDDWDGCLLMGGGSAAMDSGASYTSSPDCSMVTHSNWSLSLGFSCVAEGTTGALTCGTSRGHVSRRTGSTRQADGGRQDRGNAAGSPWGQPTPKGEEDSLHTGDRTHNATNSRPF